MSTVHEARARVDREVARVWATHHAPWHPTVTLAEALRHEQLGRVVRAHALANIRHDLDGSCAAPSTEVSHAA